MTTKATISDEAVETWSEAWKRETDEAISTAVEQSITRLRQRLATIDVSALTSEAAYPHITPHGIGVKGLEWTDYTGLAFRGGASSFGRGAVCLYHAYGDGAWCSDISADGMRSGGNLASAKAAAQADYETRILSSLQRNPEGDVEPVAWRVRSAYDDPADAAWYLFDSPTTAAKMFGEDTAETQPLYLHPPRGQGAGARDVLAERERQVAVEGWTPEHDDRHRIGEIALAAAAYAYGSQYNDDLRRSGGRPMWWPWDTEWWKPTNPRRDLIKAGALILAEIDRLDRAALSPKATKRDRV